MLSVPLNRLSINHCFRSYPSKHKSARYGKFSASVARLFQFEGLCVLSRTIRTNGTELNPTIRFVNRQTLLDQQSHPAKVKNCSDRQWNSVRQQLHRTLSISRDASQCFRIANGRNLVGDKEKLIPVFLGIS